MKIRVHKILKNTQVEGPGKRYCIIFQGCSKHCKGCWATQTWDFNGGIEASTQEIIKDILNTKNIEGVTFLGGEPFEQYSALLELAKEIKKQGLSTICFTGKTIDEIKQNYSDVLPFLDILIDGEFKEEEKDYSRPWVGSRNQNYHFLSDRYSQNILKEHKNKIEINIEKNGRINLNGMGNFEKITEYLNLILK